MDMLELLNAIVKHQGHSYALECVPEHYKSIRQLQAAWKRKAASDASSTGSSQYDENPWSDRTAGLAMCVFPDDFSEWQAELDDVPSFQGMLRTPRQRIAVAEAWTIGEVLRQWLWQTVYGRAVRQRPIMTICVRGLATARGREEVYLHYWVGHEIAEEDCIADTPSLRDMEVLVNYILPCHRPVWHVAKAMRLTGRKRLLYYEARMLCYEVFHGTQQTT